MAREIKESDWKVCRRLQTVALERFCKRVLEDVRAATAESSNGYHESYLKVYDLIQDRNSRMADAFDNMKRSNAFILLANIKAEGLLTEDELNQFSPEARDAIEAIEYVRNL